MRPQYGAQRTVADFFGRLLAGLGRPASPPSQPAAAAAAHKTLLAGAPRGGEPLLPPLDRAKAEFVQAHPEYGYG